MIFETLTEQRWRHQWQVVRVFAYVPRPVVLASHRTELVALLHASVRNVFDRGPDRVYGVRRSPEVVR
jgi:hypothetical protein